MASKLKIKVNGLVHNVTASLDTPLLYVLHNELHLHGPRFGCGLAQCGACSVLLDGKEIRLVRDAGRRGERQGDHDARGPAGSLREVARHVGVGSAVAASAAAGVDRRSGAALRLLPERDDDPGRRSAGDDEAPDRGSDPHGDERPSLPLWHVSAHPDGDPEGRGCDGEGREVTMTELMHEQGVLAQDVRQGRRRADRRLQRARRRQRRGGERQHAVRQRDLGRLLPDLTQVDSWITITPTTRPSSRTARPSSVTGTPTGILMIVAEELDMGMDQMAIAHPETWLNATGGGGGTAASRAARRRPARRPRMRKQVLLGLASTQLGVPVASLTVGKGVVSGGGKTVKYGDLLGGKLFNFTITDTAARPRATPGQGVAKPVSDYKVVGKLVPADRHPGQGERHATPTSTTSAFRGCCTRGSSAPAAPAPTRRRTTSRSASTRTRSSTSRARRSCRSTTSSPSWRRRSTTRSRLRRS